MKTKNVILALSVIFLFTTYDAEAKRIRCCKRINREVKDVREEIRRTDVRIQKELNRVDPVLAKLSTVYLQAFQTTWLGFKEWILEKDFQRVISFQDFLDILKQKITVPWDSDCTIAYHGKMPLKCFPKKERQRLEEALNFLENDPNIYPELGFSKVYPFIESHVRQFIWMPILGISSDKASSKWAGTDILGGETITMGPKENYGYFFSPDFFNVSLAASSVLHEALHTRGGHTCPNHRDDLTSTHVTGSQATYMAKLSVLGHPQFKDCREQEKLYDYASSYGNSMCTDDKVHVERNYPRPCEVSNPPPGSTLAHPLDSQFTQVGNEISDFSQEPEEIEVSLSIGDDGTKYVSYVKDGIIYIDTLGPKDIQWKRFTSRQEFVANRLYSTFFKNALYLVALSEKEKKIVLYKFDLVLKEWKVIFEKIGGQVFLLSHDQKIYFVFKNTEVSFNFTTLQESLDGDAWNETIIPNSNSEPFLYITRKNHVCLGENGLNLTEPSKACDEPQLGVQYSEIDILDDYWVSNVFYISNTKSVYTQKINSSKDVSHYTIPFKHYYRTISVLANGLDLGPIFPCKTHKANTQFMATAIKDNKVYVLYTEEGINKSTGRRVIRLLLKETSL